MVSGPLPATTCSICWIPSTKAARWRAAFRSRSTTSPHAGQLSRSTTTVPYPAARPVVSWCGASARKLATRPWWRANLCWVLRQPLDGGRSVPAGARGPLLAGQMPAHPAQPPELGSERPRVGNQLAAGQHGQVSDPHIDPDAARWPPRAPLRSLDLAGERHKPAVTLLADRGAQDPGGPLLQPTSELASGLVSLQTSEPRQGHMVAVGLDSNGAGGKPARLSAATAALAPFHSRRKAGNVQGTSTSWPAARSSSRRLTRSKPQL
jgi:hypothetical protein